jgi:hypothetical protein
MAMPPQARTSWLRIALINVLVLVAIVVAVEFVTRAWASIQLCRRGQCGRAPLASISVRNSLPLAENVGLSRLDNELGYAPTEGFDSLILQKGWEAKKVTIDKRGIRSNDNTAAPSKPDKILAVGDSFTFGGQVANSETWPSCLERETGMRVDNGGVFGYGTAQALKRAEVLARAETYSAVILSVLVGRDFERDRLSYRSGFAKPAVIRKDGKLLWSASPDPYRSGTKYNPSTSQTVLFLNKYSLVGSYFIGKMLADPSNNILGDRLTVVHPEAADKNDILAWTVQELARLGVKRRIVMLQYDSHYGDKDATEERRLLLEAIAQAKVEHVDTYATLASLDKRALWRGHHTPYGNTVVCKDVAKVF